MAIRKKSDGKYLVEVYPQGRNGKRVRKTFPTQNEAKRFELFTLSETEQKPWMPAKDDNRRLSELIDVWFNSHGQSLSDGIKRKKKLESMALMMGDPVARHVKKVNFSKYRQERLKNVSIKTVNNDQTYLNALFNELNRLGEWLYENPILGLRSLKYQQPEMGFLSQDDVVNLFGELNKSNNSDVYLVAKICISTGCRWSEAERLTGSQVTPYRLTFIHTKGKKHRTVPISKELYNEIPKKNGRIFTNCIGAFGSALKRTAVQLPKGQSTHVLRHSFASHFMTHGGNILVLKQILGHSSITDTMKYAHFSPTHLEDAVKLNPFSTLSLDSGD